MSSPRYPFAPDEFDAPADAGAPVGVHRTPRSTWSKVLPFVLVAVIFAGLALGIVAVMSRTGEDVASGADGTSGGGTSASAEPSKSAEETPAEEETPTEEPTEAATEEPSADVDALVAAADTSAYVRILNEGGPAGEAAKAQTALTGKGFSKTEAANPTTATGASGTVVWYTEGREDTAAAVAAVLGIPTAQIEGPIALRQGDVVVVIQDALTLP